MEHRSIISEWKPEGNRLIGYAAVFDSPATINDGSRTFSEVIKAGAFRNAIESKADIIATFNHSDRLLGRTASGTLRLAEDSHGLRMDIDLPESAADLKELVKRGDIAGASFTFVPRKGGQAWDGNTRTLTDVFLYEVGPVIMPAYRNTQVALRGNDYFRMRLQLAEKFMRR